MSTAGMMALMMGWMIDGRMSVVVVVLSSFYRLLPSPLRAPPRSFALDTPQSTLKTLFLSSTVCAVGTPCAVRQSGINSLRMDTSNFVGLHVVL